MIRFSRDTFMPNDNRYLTQISSARQTDIHSSRISNDFPGNKYKASQQNSFSKAKVTQVVYLDGIYTGEVIGDIREGYGTLIFNDGGMYEGEWISNKM